MNRLYTILFTMLLIGTVQVNAFQPLPSVQEEKSPSVVNFHANEAPEDEEVLEIDALNLGPQNHENNDDGDDEVGAIFHNLPSPATQANLISDIIPPLLSLPPIQEEITPSPPSVAGQHSRSRSLYSPSFRASTPSAGSIANREDSSPRPATPTTLGVLRELSPLSSTPVMQSINRLIWQAIQTNTLDTPDAQGRTKLHSAIRAYNLYAIDKLLEAGARTDIPDSDGKTALDLATSAEGDQILAIFTAHNRITPQPSPSPLPPLSLSSSSSSSSAPDTGGK